MGRFSEMSSPVRDPGRELPRAPHRILPVTGNPQQGWGPAPTGYYPDFNAERQGVARTDDPVREPNGSPGGPAVPATAVNAEIVDQHAFLQVSGTWTPVPSIVGNGRPSGYHDPQTDGPGPPTPRLLSTWYYRGAGSQRTAYMDVPDGRVFPKTGSQDGASTTWFQDVAAATAPYGVDPASYDPRHPERSTDMPESLKAIPAGPAHGWSNVPVSPGPLLARNQTARRRGQQSVRQNRLAQSTYAGQTYSQSTAHVANPAGYTTAYAGSPGGATVPGLG